MNKVTEQLNDTRRGLLWTAYIGRITLARDSNHIANRRKKIEKFLTHLQREHESTGSSGNQAVEGSLPGTNVDSLGSSKGTSRVGGGAARGAGATSGTSVKRASNSASTGSTSGSELGSARAGSGGLLGGSGTGEAAGGGILAVLLVVLVEGPGETLDLVAGAVGSVGTAGSVGGNTVHDVTLVTEVVQVLGDGLVGDVGGGDTGQRVVHARAEVRVDGRGQLAGGEPVAGVDGRAATANGGGDGVVAHGNTGGGSLLHLGGQVLEVLQGRDGVTGGGNQTVLVGGLEVHVDNTTGPDVVHLVTEEDGDISEGTGAGVVAAVLGEESGDGVVGKLLSAGLVTRALVAGVTAPLVDVVTEEVNGVGSIVTDQVVGNVLTDGSIVVSGVTNGEGGAVVLLGDVGLHVTDGGLDVGHGISVVDAVGNLVTGEETDDIGVAGESINDSGVTLEDVGVPHGVILLNGLGGGRQITDDVDTSVGQSAHTLVVGGVGVDGVSTDNVGAQLLQVGDITLAAVSIGQGVDVVVAAATTVTGAVVGLVGNTTDVELSTVLVEELLSLNLNGREVGSQGRSQQGQTSEDGVLHRESTLDKNTKKNPIKERLKGNEAVLDWL